MCTMGHVGNIGCGDPRIAYRFGGVKCDNNSLYVYDNVQKYNAMVLSKKFSNYDT
jgi:hypothetical protein